MKRYIRTKDGIYNFEEENNGLPKMPERYGTSGNCSGFPCIKINKNEDIIKQADTIEELCDCFVKIKRKGNCKPYILKFDHKDLPTLKEQAIKYKDSPVYGAIHIEDKGLIYVAKINDKGELVLL